MSAAPDPVVARRARIARAVKLGKRAGYGGLGVAIVTFAIGLVSGFSGLVVALSIGGLVAACVILPVPIVVGYGIRAAEREERGGGRFH